MKPSARATSAKTKRLYELVTPLQQFFFESPWAKRFGDSDICDFTIGNPHDLPMTAFTEAMRHWTLPQDKYWYSYKMNEDKARSVAATSLAASHGLPFRPRDIFLTNGSIAALAVVFDTILNPGDEVIFISPPWFMYEAMIVSAGGKPVKVRMDESSFDLDLRAIASAITPGTRALIVNSPHNPTGKIYPPPTLQELAKILESATAQNGRTVYLISDEAYRRIIFDQRQYVSPATCYPHSFVVYTYGKVLLAPGQRIGYVALPPHMPAADQIGDAIQALQMIKGWSFPNALMQHALTDLEQMSVDMEHLQRKRDRLVAALRQQGYGVRAPEATFYIIVRSPWEDDIKFVELLNSLDIFCIPGSLMDFPAHFRLSLTASDAMIDRALPKFAQALKKSANDKHS